MSNELAMALVVGGLLLVGVFLFSTRGDWKMADTSNPTILEQAQAQGAQPAPQPPGMLETAPAHVDPPGSTWSLWGWFILAVGLIGIVVSLLLPITVSTFVPSTSPYLPSGSSDIVNLGLLFRKGAALAGSLAAVGAGLFCVGIGSLIRAIHTRAV